MRTKRLEYKYGTMATDEDLEKNIQERANRFVDDILTDIGKEYIIPDLEPLIMGSVLCAISDKAIIETQENMMEDWEKNKEN